MRLFHAAAAMALASLAASPAAPGAPAADWAVNATVIEACSCPMFCQCYFNDKPAGHHTPEGHKHFCKGNLAWKINKGRYGDVKLDGVKFWMAGDLGGDFRTGQGEWAVLTHDRSTTAAQREAVGVFLKRILPMQWKSYAEAEGLIDTWQQDNDTAVATLDGGKTAEIRLKRFPGMTSEPIVIRNLPYVAAPRNDGFVLMPNDVEAYRVGPNAFEFKGTNGFTLTVDVNSSDPMPPPPGRATGGVAGDSR
jgi:uncharacterized protein DUF1326